MRGTAPSPLPCCLQPEAVVTSTGQQALSILLVLINLLTVAYFILCLAKELYVLAHDTLDKDRSGAVSGSH